MERSLEVLLEIPVTDIFRDLEYTSPLYVSTYIAVLNRWMGEAQYVSVVSIDDGHVTELVTDKLKYPMRWDGAVSHIVTSSGFHANHINPGNLRMRLLGYS